MVYNDRYMLEPVVSSEVKLFMVMMLLSRRNPLARPVTVPDVAACVVGLERAKK